MSSLSEENVEELGKVVLVLLRDDHRLLDDADRAVQRLGLKESFYLLEGPGGNSSGSRASRGSIGPGFESYC